MAARDEGDWLEFTAELMREPLTALPVERVTVMLRDTFEGTAVAYNAVEAGGFISGELYPLDASLAGHREEMLAWGREHAGTNPLARYYRGTGDMHPIQLADVPEPYRDMQVYGEGAALARRCGSAEQLAFPCGEPSRPSALVVARSRRFDARELRLADRIWRVLGGLERQATAYAGAVQRAAGAVRSPVAIDLTPRERAVLALLAEGLTAMAIARRLGIAERTVHKHLERCYGKLGVADRLSAVLRAQRLGLVAA